MVTAGEARELYQLLTEAGVRCWVAGGWGVDALLGRANRPHKDLDLLLVQAEHARAWQLLHGAGFALELVWEENVDAPSDEAVLPTAYVLADSNGRQVDIHVLGEDLRPLWSTDRVMVDGALTATGTIDGIQVSCMSAPMQQIAHTGYLLPDEQRRDVELLGALSIGERGPGDGTGHR